MLFALKIDAISTQLRELTSCVTFQRATVFQHLLNLLFFKSPFQHLCLRCGQSFQTWLISSSSSRVPLLGVKATFHWALFFRTSSTKKYLRAMWLASREIPEKNCFRHLQTKFKHIILSIYRAIMAAWVRALVFRIWYKNSSERTKYTSAAPRELSYW